jgi:hypothetical protein
VTVVREALRDADHRVQVTRLRKRDEQAPEAHAPSYLPERVCDARATTARGAANRGCGAGSTGGLRRWQLWLCVCDADRRDGEERDCKGSHPPVPLVARCRRRGLAIHGTTRNRFTTSFVESSEGTMKTGELRDRANAALVMAIDVLVRSPHSLARSLGAKPDQWTDAPVPARQTRASRHLVPPAPPRVPDDSERTGVFQRFARGSVVVVRPVERPLRVTRPGRYRSLTAMSAGFEIERLLTE